MCLQSEDYSQVLTLDETVESNSGQPVILFIDLYMYCTTLFISLSARNVLFNYVSSVEIGAFILLVF